jgi:ribosomal protein S18 acetylase RimI-like enzyme
MNSLLYRRGTIDDLFQLKNLGIASYTEFSKILTDENWKIMNNNLHNEDRLTDIITRSKIFVCETNNTLVGMAYLLLSGNPTNIYPADWSYIRMVGVSPGYRNMGIGKKLTGMCIGMAIEKGEKIIGLHTSEVMDAARHVYESLGFRIFKGIEPLYGVKYWVYKRDL